MFRYTFNLGKVSQSWTIWAQPNSKKYLSWPLKPKKVCSTLCLYSLHGDRTNVMDNCAPPPTPTANNLQPTRNNPISLQNPALLYPGLAPAVRPSYATRENLSLSTTKLQHQTLNYRTGCLLGSKLCYPKEFSTWLPTPEPISFRDTLSAPDIVRNQTHIVMVALLPIGIQAMLPKGILNLAQTPISNARPKLSAAQVRA